MGQGKRSTIEVIPFSDSSQTDLHTAVKRFSRRDQSPTSQVSYTIVSKLPVSHIFTADYHVILIVREECFKVEKNGSNVSICWIQYLYIKLNRASSISLDVQANFRFGAGKFIQINNITES